MRKYIYIFLKNLNSVRKFAYRFGSTNNALDGNPNNCIPILIPDLNYFFPVINIYDRYVLYMAC